VKIIRGLAASTSEDLYIISNVGDNIWMHGLYICPDIDTVLYGLANQLDEQKGWGVKDDTFNFLHQMNLLGEDIWFKLGDKDLSTHLKRTEMLNNGRKLSEITEWMRRKYSVSSKIIPASDDYVETRIITNLGDMHIQEFWVKHKAQPQVKDIIYKDNKRARAHPIAIKAIRQSKLIIIAPANPVTSIGPIVSLAGMRDELISNKEKTVAISPLVSNAAISGPAVKYMHAMKIVNSPLGVAKYYSEFISKFIISMVDEPLRQSIFDIGIKVHQTDILMADRHEERRLGLYLINQFL
jgi:LPPG:FO 2-phospho-L-lactate transferase